MLVQHILTLTCFISYLSQSNNKSSAQRTRCSKATRLVQYHKEFYFSFQFIWYFIFYINFTRELLRHIGSYIIVTEGKWNIVYIQKLKMRVSKYLKNNKLEQQTINESCKHSKYIYIQTVSTTCCTRSQISMLINHCMYQLWYKVYCKNNIKYIIAHTCVLFQNIIQRKQTYYLTNVHQKSPFQKKLLPIP